MIKILKVEDARGKQTSKHQRHNIARRRNRYARAFPPETRQPDRAPIVLFTTFLRWRRYWQFSKSTKTINRTVLAFHPLPFSLSLSLFACRVSPIVFHPRVYSSFRTLPPREKRIDFMLRRDRHTRNCIVKIIFGIDPLVKFVILSPLSWYI